MQKQIDKMNQELINSIADYVEKNIGEFHKARVAKLQSINLKELLSRKNPYISVLRFAAMVMTIIPIIH